MQISVRKYVDPKSMSRSRRIQYSTTASLSLVQTIALDILSVYDQHVKLHSF